MYGYNLKGIVSCVTFVAHDDLTNLRKETKASINWGFHNEKGAPFMLFLYIWRKVGLQLKQVTTTCG